MGKMGKGEAMSLLFGHSDLATDEDICKCADRLNLFFAVNNPKALMPKKAQEEEITDLDFWHEHEEYVKHITF